MVRNLNALLKQLARDRKGQGMVEYALLVAGVALVAIVGVSMMGHKTGDLIGTVASVLPGSHADDNGPIISSHLIETSNSGNGIGLDATKISGTNRSTLNDKLVGNGSTDAEFVTETDETTTNAGGN